ncbi:unnamed protein product, partial [Chrysoparadoxa australica]
MRGILLAAQLLELLAASYGEMVYGDFNETYGLAWVGSAAVSSCVNVTGLEYGFSYGDADELEGWLPAQEADNNGYSVSSTEYSTSLPEDQ